MLTILSNPSPVPNETIRSQVLPRGFLAYSPICECRYIVRGASHRYGCTIEACPRRILVAAHQVCHRDKSLVVYNTYFYAKQSNKRHHVAL